MKLAILFWFYKEPGICENRLILLRRYNPDTPIYGLYGGDLESAELYRSRLGRYLDDFYVFSQQKDSYWKWYYGDLMITTWFTERGQALPWDTIVIAQWDMLLFGSVNQLFQYLGPNEILLSGVRPVKEVEQDWWWTSPEINPKQQKIYLNFVEHVRAKYDLRAEILCCLFLVVGLPKNFLEKYSEIEPQEVGFLEYKIPTYAQIFGVPFCKHPYNYCWSDYADYKYTLSPWPFQIGLSPLVILKNLLNPSGDRIFHPYLRRFPLKPWEWIPITFTYLKEKFAYEFKKQKGIVYEPRKDAEGVG
jgi:hypothetical protein